MPRHDPLTTTTPWFRLTPEPGDWQSLPLAELARWYEQAALIRAFEHRILDLANMGLVHGPAHASVGQEATAVGAMAALNDDDRTNGTHRAHHQILAKLLNHARTADYDPLSSDMGAPMRQAVRRFMAEIMGLAEGYAGGRGGSMHMRDATSGILGTNAIVGGNLPHAAGYALADRTLGRDTISVAFFGDGALMQGTTHEAMNIAALYDLPVIFFVENNLYAVATRLEDQTRAERLTSRGAMLDMPAIEVDGMDALAVYLAMQEARQIIRDGAGPVMIEAQCYRHLHQIGLSPGSAFGYRSKDEEQSWRARDPLEQLRARLTDLHALPAAQVEALEARAQAAVDEATEALTRKTGNRHEIPAEAWPDPARVEDGILGSGQELQGLPWRELSDYPARDLTEMTMIEAAARTLADNMARNPTIIVLGEDVHRMRGGVTGVTRLACEAHPDRVLQMPIAENGFVGLALGAALNGLRPVVEIMFSDFCLVAADQLFNQIAKVRHMFGGAVDVPLLLRLRVVPDTGYGSQHSGDHAALFAMFPGWRIFAPSTPFDYQAMMNTALRSNDPVVIVETAALFQTSGPVPVTGPDIGPPPCLPFGRAHVVRPGRDCTVLCTPASLAAVQEAAGQLDLDAEVIDLRSLDPDGLDWDTIGRSLRATNRLMIAEQTAEGLTLGPRIAAGVQARFFDHLDAEVLCISGGRAAPVVSRPLNAAALGDSARFAAGLRQLMQMEGTTP
ncbi:alpha-ketoacid dehydrogenase subunit alpha/beta [Salipiger abyssi]|uniref:alpha-ketoacid dehydrogenase subunit alpha/beta n=1 Tax=Salipiger abyssi TaxID=1250539 RepID=UPI004059B7B1